MRGSTSAWPAWRSSRAADVPLRGPQLIGSTFGVIRGVIHEFAEIAGERMKIRGTRWHLVPRFPRSGDEKVREVEKF